MNSAPSPKPQAGAAQQQPKGIEYQAQANPAPPTNLREALVEAHEIIQAVQQALKPARSIEDEETRYRAFIKACADGDLQQVLALLDSGVDVNQPSTVTGLHLAAANGHLEIARELLDRGAKVDARAKHLEELDALVGGATPLILAIVNHRDLIGELLVSRGADPHAKANNGHTGQFIRQAINPNGDKPLNLFLC